MTEANYDEVICPNCVTQFRAIPVNVQNELAALKAELARPESTEVSLLRAERDTAVRKLAVLSRADILENLYQVGLAQEREITTLTKERDGLTAANRDLQDWFDALKTDHDALKAELEIARMVPYVAAMSEIAKERDALKDAARMALDVLEAAQWKSWRTDKAIAALKAVL